jgi:hypothetical protein
VKDTDWWKIITVFILSAIGSALVEVVLLKVEPLVAIGLLALTYFLLSLRFVPWKTPLRKGFSIGLGIGVRLPVILWRFGVALT